MKTVSQTAIITATCFACSLTYATTPNGAQWIQPYNVAISHYHHDRRNDTTSSNSDAASQDTTGSVNIKDTFDASKNRSSPSNQVVDSTAGA